MAESTETSNAPEQAQKTSEKPAENGAPNFKIVDKVVNDVPIVKTAIEIVDISYNKVKNVNVISKSTFYVTEKYFSIWAFAMKPFVYTMKGPIGYADNLACSGLDKIEEAVPSIKKNPEELYGDIRQYTNGRVQLVKDYGYNRISPYLNFGDNTLNNVITFANSWLPKSEETEVPENVNSLVRFKAFSRKVSQLVLQQALKTTNMIKERAMDTYVGKLAISSVEYVNKVTLDMAERLRKQALLTGENVEWLYNEITREESEDEKKEISLKRTGIRTAKKGYSVVKYFYGKLPSSLHENLENGAKYANEVYGEFKKSENVNDVYLLARNQIETGVEVTRTWIVTYVPLASKVLAKSKSE